MGSRQKKDEQLGMPLGTAANRLVKSLLHQFAVLAGHKCFRCGGDLSRENFSVEHKVPWLDSEDPKAMYFDLGNIAYSHLSCNTAAARKRRKYASPEEKLEAVRKSNRDRMRNRYTTDKRRDKYARTGW